MSEAPRVVEAGLRVFACAYERYVEDTLLLGQFVTVREGRFPVFGVVAETASGPEDQSRPLQPTGGERTAAEVFAANPHIRPLLRTRLTVVCCGYADGEAIRAQLPPAPPPLLGRVEAATHDEIERLADDGTFLALLIPAPAADDAVLAAALASAAAAFGAGAREFTVRAGKELARLLRADPARLANILRGVAG